MINITSIVIGVSILCLVFLGASHYFTLRSNESAMILIQHKIQSRDALTKADIDSIIATINDKFDSNTSQSSISQTTLLNTALRSGNVQAATLLLQAGANPNIYDGNEKSRNFFTMIADTQSEIGPPPGYKNKINIDQSDYSNYIDDFYGMIADFLKVYLAVGGDPNVMAYDGVRMVGTAKGVALHEEEIYKPLVSSLADNERLTPFLVLLRAGANPWLPSTWKAAHETDYALPDGAVYVLARNQNATTTLQEMIDLGYFTNRPQTEIQQFLERLGMYSQRGDKYSLEIQDIAKRILKRNKNYNQSLEASGKGTKSIFKSFQDRTDANIPWSEIDSDRVK